MRHGKCHPALLPGLSRRPPAWAVTSPASPAHSCSLVPSRHRLGRQRNAARLPGSRSLAGLPSRCGIWVFSFEVQARAHQYCPALPGNVSSSGWAGGLGPVIVPADCGSQSICPSPGHRALRMVPGLSCL